MLVYVNCLGCVVSANSKLLSMNPQDHRGGGRGGRGGPRRPNQQGDYFPGNGADNRQGYRGDRDQGDRDGRYQGQGGHQGRGGGHQGRGGHQGDYFAGNGARDHQGHRGGGGGHRGGHGNDRGGRGGGDRAPQGFRGGDRRRDEHHGHGHSQGHGGYRGGQGGRGHGGANRGGHGSGQGHGYGQGHDGAQGPPVSLSEHDVKFSLQQMLNLLDRGAVEEASSELTKRNTKARVAHALSNAATIAVDTRQALWKLVAHPRLARDRDAPLEQQRRLATFLADALGSPLLSKTCVLFSLQVEGHGPSVAALVTRAAEHNTPEVLHKVKSDDLKFVIEKITEARIPMSEGLLADMRRVAAGNPTPAPVRREHVNAARDRQLEADLAEAVTFRTEQTVPAVGTFAPPPYGTVTTNGPLRSLPHHLDALYYLRRADALLPLYESVQKISTHRRGGPPPDRDCARFYEVTVAGAAISPVHGTLAELQFEAQRSAAPKPKRGKKNAGGGGGISWERTKRLQSGSLVVLIGDDVGATLVAFGYIVDVEKDATKEVMRRYDGLVAVRLRPEPMLLLQGEWRGRRLTLVDAETLWDGFAHVLEALRDIEASDFDPVLRCDLGADNTLPRVADARPRLEMHPRAMDAYDRAAFQIHDGRDEPRDVAAPEQERRAAFAAEKNFDATQRAGWEHLLDSRIGIVQGPPGTGKSYVGVAMIQYLLQHTNEKILLLCYTNHALDSCVADILKAVGSTALAPGRLVRLGGRSKLEGMQEYTLRALQSTRVRAGEWGRLLDNFREGLERWGDSEVLPSTLEYDPALSRQAKALWRNGALPKLLKELEDLMAEKRAVHRAAKSRVQSAHANKENARTRYANAVDAREPVSQGVIDALEAEVVKATEKEAECVAAEKAAFLDVKFFLTRWAGSHRNAAAAALPDVSVDALLRGGADDGEAVGRAEAQDEVPLPPCVANPHRFEGQAKLTQPQRQAVHAYVRSEWQRGLMGELRRVGAAFERAHVQRQAEMQQADLSILRSARIIAATTSGAARNIAQLRQANRSTIVVEEAAEIAESDVLACIVPSARRLCQLGDHQQLRPKVNEFKLERHGANVSLMERLIRNDAVDFKTLGTQRRMRPAIADFTRWMYDSRVEGGIQDHPCVTADGARPDVAGLRGNVFFVDHSAPESTDNATRSHTNDQEAVFIWRLVAYLVMNRLKVDRVVVVTTYLGQDMLLSRQRPQELKGVRVTTVDNYQGEENDVVIISLVRSDAPGFVRNANRVCVLLSRARCGMIVLGNLTKVFAALTGKNDVFDAADDNGDGAEPTFVWPRVLDVAKEQGALVDALPLKCREHGNETSVPVVGGRFPALGGCGQNCGARRKCGHACDFQCHGAPCETFSCKKPCARKCAAGLHECKAECGQQCPPCTVPVKRAIGCEGRHTMPVPCHETRVDQMCTQRIKCDLPCKHEGKRRCLPVGAPLSFLGCESRCGGELICGHECERKCPACRRDGPSGPVRHKSCTHKCDRALPCGHSCKANCSDVCPPCEQPCVDACEHSACRHKCGEPCIQCVEPCTVGCEHRQCTKRCGEACDVKPCEEPCPKKLKCGAPCPGLCGEACPELACACPKCDKRKDVVELLGIEMDDDVRFVVACAAGHPVCVEAMDQLLKVWRKDRHEGQLKPPTCPVCKGFITARRYKADLAVAAADLTIIKQRMADELERAIATAAEAKATLLSCTSEATEERLPKPADKWKRKADSLLQDFDKSKAGRNIRLCVRFTWKAARMSTVWRLLLRPAMGHDDVMAAVRAPLENLLGFHERDHDDPKTAHAAATTAVLVAGLTAIDRGVAARLPPLPSPATEAAVAEYSAAVEKALANASVGLSEEELASIHRVLAAAGQIRERGAWHRHSCGYMYVIGDCGGAVMTGNCPQCGGALGGTGHMRAAGNDVVGVADGATQRDRDRWGHGLVHGMMMGN